METNQTERNKQIVRNIFENIINTGKLELLGDVVSEEYTGPQGEKGPTGFAKTISGLRTGFPDIKWTVEDLFAEGDKVALRWSWKGTHQGIFMGYEPTHKQMTNTALVIYQLTNGKLSAVWIQTDRVGFLQQMGVIPQDIRSLVRKEA